MVVVWWWFGGEEWRDLFPALGQSRGLKGLRVWVGVLAKNQRAPPDWPFVGSHSPSTS
jgi:hypothetical protein